MDNVEYLAIRDKVNLIGRVLFKEHLYSCNVTHFDNYSSILINIRQSYCNPRVLPCKVFFYYDEEINNYGMNNNFKNLKYLKPQLEDILNKYIYGKKEFNWPAGCIG